MLIIEIILGCLIIFYGAFAVVTGKDLLWRTAAKTYTEDSIVVYNRLAGIVHILIGGAAILFFLGNSPYFPVLLKWIGVLILWLSLATNGTLYLITLVKK